MSRGKTKKKRSGAAKAASARVKPQSGGAAVAVKSTKSAKGKSVGKIQSGAGAAVARPADHKGMMRMHWGIFVLGAVLCWGLYGPALHAGQLELKSGVRAMLWVGFAYFLVGVITPGLILLTTNEPGQFTMKGNTIATAAGMLGALGAVCIIFAFKSGGLPIYVMPLVFGGAPVVNVLTTMILHPPHKAPHPLLYVGFVMAALGAFLVLKFKPS